MDLTLIHNRWLAAQVHVGREFAVAAGIRHRGYEEFVPSYEKGRGAIWDRSTRAKAPLFVGYVFVRFDAHNPHRIVTVPGVIRLVGTGHQPTPIDDIEMRALQSAIRSRKKCRPCVFIDIGKQIEIEHGALSGLKGRLVRWKNQHSLIVSVGLLRQSILIELDSCDVKLCSAASNSQHH